jgi:hypothetical protein
MRADEIVARGKAAYLADDLLQEAGDSLMMKLGEGRLVGRQISERNTDCRHALREALVPLGGT